MHITRIQLTNFRNYTSLELAPCEGVTVLVGDNAQGKTNALEAVYLTCTGRSHRTRQDRELVKWGEPFCSVHVDAVRRDGSHDVEIIIPETGRRKLKISGQDVSRSGELMGHVTGVLFAPEDLRTVKDGPAERRRFIDMALSQLRPAYYYALQRYMRALKQRNEVLKAAQFNPSMRATLPSWDEQLAAACVEVMRHRTDYIARLSAAAAETHEHIALGREKLKIEYRPSAEADDVESVLSALSAARETDLKRQTTSVGAHRDDILLLVGDKDVRAFGSQGQQRTAALAMRLSELTVMTAEMGEAPILMLDDVMSELDPSRRRQLLSHLSGIQTLVTCTDMDDLAGAEVGQAWRVSGAELTQII